MYTRTVGPFTRAIALGVMLLFGGGPIAALACDWACESAAQAAATPSSQAHHHHHHPASADQSADAASLANGPTIAALNGACQELSVAPSVLVSAAVTLPSPSLLASHHDAVASASRPVRAATGHSPPLAYLNPLRI
jgi:hypothetical protein